MAGLDPSAWAFLKSEVVPLLLVRDVIRGWQPLFDKLNQAKAYNHLKEVGYDAVRFIPRSSVGEKTPDLVNFYGGGSSASVSNAGRISAGSGGFVALLGGTVSNSGTISVPLGRVGLGSGERATLDLNGDGFLQVAVPTGTFGDGASETPARKTPQPSQIDNLGILLVDRNARAGGQSDVGRQHHSEINRWRRL